MEESQPAPGALQRADTVQSVVRCFAVLEALLDDPERGSTMAQLALRTGLPRPVVRRLLLTLRELGYVEASGAYWRITPRILMFGARYSDSTLLIRICRPHIEQVARELNETTVVGQAFEGACRFIAGAVGEHHSAAHVTVGSQLPLHATAAGLVLLAWLDEVPQVPFVRHTERTIRSRAELLDRLRQVREDGFAIAIEELEAGLGAAAAPIRDSSGAVIAALNTAVPLGRRTPEQIRNEIVPVLVDAARAISADLRHTEPSPWRT